MSQSHNPQRPRLSARVDPVACDLVADRRRRRARGSPEASRRRRCPRARTPAAASSEHVAMRPRAPVGRAALRRLDHRDLAMRAGQIAHGGNAPAHVAGAVMAMTPARSPKSRERLRLARACRSAGAVAGLCRRHEPRGSRRSALGDAGACGRSGARLPEATRASAREARAAAEALSPAPPSASAARRARMSISPRRVGERRPRRAVADLEIRRRRRA